MQDGARPHSAASTQQWLRDHVPHFLPAASWPPNSPDLNPIETIWSTTRQHVLRRNCRTVAGIKRAIRQESMKTAPTIRKLYEDLHANLVKVVDSGGAAL